MKKKKKKKGKLKEALSGAMKRLMKMDDAEFGKKTKSLLKDVDKAVNK